MGLTLNTEDNFNSIPGLSLWLDGRERVTEVSGRVAFWGDKSISGINVTENRPTKQPVWEKGIWIKSTDDQSLVANNLSAYKFLHNGSKFGIYAINKVDWSLASPASSVGLGILRTGTSSGTGLQLTLSTNNNGYVGAIVRRSGLSSSSKQLQNLLNPASANYTPSGSINIHSIVNYGQTTGVKIGYGNALAESTAFFPTTGDYPTTNHSQLYVNSAPTNIIYRGGLTLVYNWAPYTSAQVQGFHARITALLQKEKLVFQNLDSL